VFVTVDRNLAFQQPIDSLPFAVVVLRAKSNRLSDLRPLVPFLLNALSTLLPGEVRWMRKLPRQVDSFKLEFPPGANAPGTALAAGCPARRAA